MILLKPGEMKHTEKLQYFTSNLSREIDVENELLFTKTSLAIPHVTSKFCQNSRAWLTNPFLNCKGRYCITIVMSLLQILIMYFVTIFEHNYLPNCTAWISNVKIETMAFFKVNYCRHIHLFYYFFKIIFIITLKTFYNML